MNKKLKKGILIAITIIPTVAIFGVVLNPKDEEIIPTKKGGYITLEEIWLGHIIVNKGHNWLGPRKYT